MNGPWNTHNAPKDGTIIIALGRVIYHEDCFVASDPFCGQIFWRKNSSGYEGWHFLNGSLAVARALDDEVRIDWWLLSPNETAKEVA